MKFLLEVIGLVVLTGFFIAACCKDGLRVKVNETSYRLKVE